MIQLHLVPCTSSLVPCTLSLVPCTLSLVLKGADFFTVLPENFSRQCQFFSFGPRWHILCQHLIKANCMRKVIRLLLKRENGWPNSDNPFLIW